MRTARPLLRRLAAILGIVALFVMAPAVAEAHAAHRHVDATGLAGVIELAGVTGPALAVDAMRQDLSAADPTSDGCACRSCCCGHVFVAVPDADLGRADRMGGRRVAMGPDLARPSAVPEALPEPPRPFA